jgi:hypothetical protein
VAASARALYWHGCAAPSNTRRPKKTKQHLIFLFLFYVEEGPVDPMRMRVGSITKLDQKSKVKSQDTEKYRKPQNEEGTEPI